MTPASTIPSWIPYLCGVGKTRLTKVEISACRRGGDGINNLCRSPLDWKTDGLTRQDYDVSFLLLGGRRSANPVLSRSFQGFPDRRALLPKAFSNLPCNLRGSLQADRIAKEWRGAEQTAQPLLKGSRTRTARVNVGPRKKPRVGNGNHCPRTFQTAKRLTDGGSVQKAVDSPYILDVGGVYCSLPPSSGPLQNQKNQAPKKEQPNEPQAVVCAAFERTRRARLKQLLPKGSEE